MIGIAVQPLPHSTQTVLPPLAKGVPVSASLEESPIKREIASPGPRAGRNGKMQDQLSSQMWLERRLAGLTAEDFYPGPVCIYAISSLTPPPGFEGSWVHCTEKLCNKLSERKACSKAQAVRDVQAILIICNPFSEHETEIMSKLIRAIDLLGHDASPMFWVPHTVSPESRDKSMNLNIEKHSILRYTMELGIDGIVDGEPEGFELALSVSSQIHSAASRSRALTDMVGKCQQRAEFAMCIKECIHSMLWEYARVRVAPSIPAVDFDLEPGQPTELENFTVGRVLGKGAFGSVHKLNLKPGCRDDGVPHVVKFISKEGLKDISDLKSIKRTVEVHRLLSTPEHMHVNIVQLFAVFHSTTHVMFVMEDGGPENLYRRLCFRHHDQIRHQRPMALPTVNSLILQAITVIQHVHVTVGICHRDIKPENFVVVEKHERLVLKLTDFDLALIWREDMQCRTPCGTVPFSAPEVLLEPAYNGQKCDIWSLGVVLFEVLCGCRILEQALELEALGGQDSKQNKLIPLKIRDAFSKPGAAKKILMEKYLPEVEPILPMMSTMLTGMLNVNFDERWHAAQVVHCYHNFQDSG